jgi:hypothetical protein
VSGIDETTGFRAMPKIYRSMKKGEDDKPVVEDSAKGLGVRGTPVHGVVDVDLDREDRVILNGKGMSVAPAWRALPPHRISARLRDRSPAAIGSSDVYCFTMGDGSFENGPVSDGLDLLRDSATHGVVAPRQSVSLAEYQAALADTRERWVLDEA